MRKMATLAVAGALLGVLAPATPAEASEARAKGASIVYHDNSGNDQAFSIMCDNWTGPLWVQKGQSSINKCPSGYASMMDVGNNFNITCRPRVGGGAWWTIPGTNQGMTAIPTWGDRICWTNAV